MCIAIEMRFKFYQKQYQKSREIFLFQRILKKFVIIQQNFHILTQNTKRGGRRDFLMNSPPLSTTMDYPLLTNDVW
jgi:hypothetical protein